MSEQKTKSNAPWILGIVGIFLTILHYACAIVCSAGLAGLGGAAGDAEGGAKAADNSLMFGTAAAGIMFVCFILSFFGKSKASTFTGLLLIVGGITSVCMSIPHFSAAGIAAGIVYMCAGISSICNSKKIKG